MKTKSGKLFGIFYLKVTFKSIIFGKKAGFWYSLELKRPGKERRTPVE